MDLRKQLLKEHSKENTLTIVTFIQNKPEMVSELMDIFMHESYRLVQRSAWVVGDLSRTNPELIRPYIPDIISYLKRPDLHVAAKRNMMRFLQETPIDESHWGELFDIAMKFLGSNDETIAVKAFSMAVAYNIAKEVPELADELKIVIEDQLPYGSAGIKSRGRKIVSALNKL